MDECFLKKSARPGNHKLMPVTTRALRTVTNPRLRSLHGAACWGMDQHAHLYRFGLSAIDSLFRHPRFFTGSICSEFSMAWVILDMHTWDEINKYDLIRVREYWPEIKAFSFSTQFAYVLVLICRKLRRFVTRKTTHAGFLPFWQIWKHGSLSWQKETH